MPVWTRKFLEFEPLSKEDVDRSIMTEFSGNMSLERIQHLERKLQVVYTAVPKNEHGRLSHQVVRYVLHRFFVQQHGWYIRGLEPNGLAQDPAKPALPLKDWLAGHVLERFEERAGPRGVGLGDLAALAAALEDLIQQEASKEMEEVYKTLGFSVAGRLSEKDADEAIHAYLMIYLMNRNVTFDSREQFEKKFQRFQKKYRGFDAAEAFVQGVEKRHAGLHDSEGVDFATVARVVADMGEQFGSFNDVECKELKKVLLDMAGNSGKVGRIRLHDFYNKSLYSHWKFTERVDFLRTLGTLDESTASQPSVIIPNYLSSFPNCLKATTLYAVCCRNECEDLIGHLERQIATPMAPPERVAELVAGLPSDTVAAPRELPEALRARLSQMAEANGGKVHLHGRLFAQWMHHAYPLECPYPHEAGMTSPQTASEWMERTGQSSQASDEEIQKIVEEACPADGGQGGSPCAQQEELELHWSDTEELLVAKPSETSPKSSGGGKRALCLIVVLVAVAGWLAIENLQVMPEQGKKLRRPLVFLCLFLVLCAADLLDFPVFLLVASVAVLFLALQGSAKCVEPAMVKSDKYSV